MADRDRTADPFGPVVGTAERAEDLKPLETARSGCRIGHSVLRVIVVPGSGVRTRRHPVP
jgi:hypothetical protein